MNNYILSAFILLFAISCEKKSSETVNTSTTPPDSVTVPETNERVESSSVQTCYMANTGKDSVFASLDDNLGTITGKMRYKNFEKDSSYGDLNGISDGDTLKVDYVFQSEGSTSTREIWFLMKDGKLLEGIAEYDETGEKYKNTLDIKYQGGHQLSAVNCESFDNKFPK